MLSFFYSLSLLFVWVEWIQFRKKAIIYSHDYLKIDKFQVIKPSTLPSAGSGLSATKTCTVVRVF